MDLDFATARKKQIYNMLIGLVAPRPIAWVTSINLAGQVNAAPFSAFFHMERMTYEEWKQKNG